MKEPDKASTMIGGIRVTKGARNARKMRKSRTMMKRIEKLWI